jgi:hypothetical protein
MSTGLHMFFFIACLFLLRQPQPDFRLTISNPAIANSVNGLLRNVKCRSDSPRKVMNADTRLEGAAAWLLQVNYSGWCSRSGCATPGHAGGS